MEDQVVRKSIYITLTIIFLFILIGFVFIYATELKKTEIINDTYDTYSLSIVERGEPRFPRGNNRIYMILKDGRHQLARYDFELSNGGKGADMENFKLSWNEYCVSILASGAGQDDVEYIIDYNGNVRELSGENW